MMTEYLTAFFSLFFSTENQLITMFISALLSSTLLPGNSEIIFSTLASQQMLVNPNGYAEMLLLLIAVATIGNALGSFITFLMGKLLPKPKQLNSRYARWAIEKSERYGVVVLLLSWLPLVGDILCGVAGWLRFSTAWSLFYITLGKLLRYLILLATLYPILT